jgi:hypothetical protein
LRIVYKVLLTLSAEKPSKKELKGSQKMTTDTTTEAAERHIHCIDPHGMAHPASLNGRTIKLLRAIAAENAALRAEVDRLRGALGVCVRLLDKEYPHKEDEGFQYELNCARAALDAKP